MKQKAGNRRPEGGEGIKKVNPTWDRKLSTVK